jgi:hypothetical protein
MTIQDVINYLADEHQGQTLTRTHIERAVLLAYEMGMQAMRDELSVIPWRIRAGNYNLVEEAKRGS